jgi:site-specific DNA-methyltransferase (cytosine-N4-specific)
VLIQGDARHIALKDRSVQMICTSPPYFGQRSYGVEGQIGLEPTPDLYVAEIVAVFRELRRVLRDDGTAWLVLGDSYAGAGSGHRDPKRWPKQSAGEHFPGRVRDGTGLPDKNLCMIPARVGLALQDDGWWIRNAIVWQKPCAMPEAVKDRLARSYDQIFLLTKSERYYFDAAAIAEPTSAGGGRRNRRDVWTIDSDRTRGKHPAPFPRKLPELCILAGSRPGDLVFDPFVGSGTTGVVAGHLGRRWVGLDLNPEYVANVRHVTPQRARTCIEGFTDEEILEIMGCDAAA